MTPFDDYFEELVGYLGDYEENDVLTRDDDEEDGDNGEDRDILFG